MVEACFINILLLFLDYTPVGAHNWNDTSDRLYIREHFKVHFLDPILLLYTETG